jgi:hypothetical protein
LLLQMHDAHHALSESVLILLRDEDHDHVRDESNLHLSKLHLTVYCAATYHDRSYDHQCDNELHQLYAALRFAGLLGDHHHGTNDRYLDDRDLPEDDHDPLSHHDHTTDDLRDHRDLLTDGHYSDDRDLQEDDQLNHHDHTTDDLRDHRDLLTDGHYSDDRDLLEDGQLNHHDHTTDDLRDHRDLLTDGHYSDDRDLLEDDPLNHHDHTTGGHHDLLTDDRDLGHHFVRMPDDLLGGSPDAMDAHRDLPKVDRDYPKDDHGLQLVCLNDRLRHQHRRDGLDAMVCRILLPVADDVDRDFLGLALDEVYLQSARKHRTYAICE